MAGAPLFTEAIYLVCPLSRNLFDKGKLADFFNARCLFHQVLLFEELSSPYSFPSELFNAAGASSVLDLSLIDDGNAVAQCIGFIHIMRGEEYGHVIFFPHG